MTDKGEYYKTEKTIGDAFREDATRTAPPFAGIAERIAAGEPCESFGEFFAGEVIPLRQTASQKGGFWSTNRKTIAAAAAAALFLFIGGGAVLGAVFSGSVMDSKTAAEAAEDRMYYDFYDNDDNKSAQNAALEDSKVSEENVSDSDLSDSDSSQTDSSD